VYFSIWKFSKGIDPIRKKIEEVPANMDTFRNENSLLCRMDKVLNIRTVTMQRDEPGKGMGLVAKVPIKAGFVLKDIEPALGFRFDPCFDARGMKYIDSVPWLQKSNHTADKLDIHALEESIQEFVCCLKTLSHSVDKDQFCAQGGCFKCGLHPTLFAALLSANFGEFSNQKSAYNRWVKFMCIDKEIVSNTLQFFEILMVTDFLLKSEKHMSAEMMPDFVQYVWTLVGVFKTCSFSLYAAMHTPEHEAYNRWTEQMKQKVISFTKILKNKGPKSEANVLEGKALQEMMKNSPPPPQDFSVCFFSVHHQISYINGADEDTPQNVILKQCAKKVGIDHMFEHNNLSYFLETTHDINEGEYLSLGYNGLTSQAYFQINESLALWSVIAENPQLRPNISRFLRTFSSKLPGYVQKLLEQCI